MRILRTMEREAPPPVAPFALTLYSRWGGGVDTVSSLLAWCILQPGMRNGVAR